MSSTAESEPAASLAVSSKPRKFRFELYSARPDYQGYDGFVFGAIYAVVFSLVASLVIQHGSVEFIHGLYAAIPAVLHVLLFLATQWSVEVRCRVKFKCETNVEQATHVKVHPIAGVGKAGNKKVLLVPIERDGSEAAITYLKKKFVFNKSTGDFERLKFKITSPLGEYLAAMGLTDKQATEDARRYGLNTFDIPLPTFGELFKEHAVAPFFVFQVVCVFLWLMDEYWYFSLLTLFMLIVLEMQMVQQRIKDLSTLREMRIPPRPVNVLRDGNWRLVDSDKLIPGDVIALMRKVDVSIPCDVLLLQGSVLVNEAMLTGESVPQMKVAATPPPESPELEVPLDMKGLHKTHIVSAGTQIMMHQNTSKAKQFKKVPTQGTSPAAVGYVLRTGFDTTQGKLCRTILFSSERVTVSSREAIYFLLILVAFAICACIYVLYDGLVLAKQWQCGPEDMINGTTNGTSNDTFNGNTNESLDASFNDTLNSTQQPTCEKPRSTFKLFLAVSHILTAVVPPEFPIMLSLAVNLSLMKLLGMAIYCTEPFRVPLAGKIETACFDKTGTLTSDSMEVGGVHGLADYPPPESASSSGKKKSSKKESKNGDDEDRSGNAHALQPLPFHSTAVMAACSGLTVVEKEVVGDPLEKAALQAVQWEMISPDIVVNKHGKGQDRLQVLRRYPFVSELQRMAVLVKHNGPGVGFQQQPPEQKTAELNRVLALVKGSCEVMRSRLKQVPDDFASIQEDLAKNGLRVLCLAAKELPIDVMKSDPEQIDRKELETDLDFCGMLVLRNSIKQGTVSTVKQLRRSYHRVVMITGDHPLTACQVAQHVSMADRPFVRLELTSRAKEVAEPIPGSAGLLEWRSGDAEDGGKPFDIAKAVELARKRTLCIPGSALTLLSEDQRDTVIPLATVFARVSPQQKEQVIATFNKTSHTMMVGDGTNDVGALKHAHVGVSLLTAPVPPPALSPAEARERQMRRQMQMEDAVPMVRLGDASIASPFTYKGDSVKCSTNILRCGRATLSTVLMMYKIMGLNSVMNAFAMSVLTLDGVKLGDGQTAVESLLTSACFFLVSRSAPAVKLAKQTPTCSVFAWHVLVTLCIQLVVHLTVLYLGWSLANSYRSKDFRRDLEGEFAPNLTNSAVFLLLAAMHASSFLANYEGHPFMQPMTSNKPLLYSLIVFVTVIFACATEAVPELNEYLTLAPSPDDNFRQTLVRLLLADICLSVGLSKAVDWFALWLRGQAAEKRAKALGLGMQEKESRSK